MIRCPVGATRSIRGVPKLARESPLKLITAKKLASGAQAVGTSKPRSGAGRNPGVPPRVEVVSGRQAIGRNRSRRLRGQISRVWAQHEFAVNDFLSEIRKVFL